MFTTAIVAGTQAVKRTSEVIPFCHPLMINSCNITLHLSSKPYVHNCYGYGHSHTHRYDQDQGQNEGNDVDQRHDHHQRNNDNNNVYDESNKKIANSDNESNDNDMYSLLIECTVGCVDRTGVEMESLHGCMIAALTVYDMCKGISNHIIIDQCQLIQKSGGKNNIQRTLT